MTLCVTWRWEENVCMAADSSIVYAQRGTLPLGGIKVLDVPVKITTPPIGRMIPDAAGGLKFVAERPGDVLYDHRAALCFCGGYLGAYLVKEVVSDVLCHIRNAQGKAPISFEAIARLAFRFYTDVCRTLTAEKFSEHDACHMILAGYCPTTNQVRVFHFMLNSLNMPSFAEGLTDRPFSYVAIGSGEKRFEDLFRPDLAAGGVRVHFQIPRRIRDVIRQGKPDVAGTLQFAAYDSASKNFRLYGFADRDDSGSPPKCYIRGTDLEQTSEAIDDAGLHVAYDYWDPFRPGA